MLRALHAEGSVPVPEVLWFEEDTDVLGDRFVAMRPGRGPGAAGQPELPRRGLVPRAHRRSSAGRIWTSGIDTMGAIHRLDREGIGLGDIAPRTPAEQLEPRPRVPAVRRRATTPTPRSRRPSPSSRRSVPPAAVEPALCWGDSRIGNMIFADDGTVAAVLDWEMVTAGDPVQDLAWYLLLDRHHHEAFDVPRLDGPARPSRRRSRAGRRPAAARPSTSSGTSCSAPRATPSIMTRVLKLLDATGVFPGGAEMAYDQTGSQLLRRLLDERT